MHCIGMWHVETKYQKVSADISLTIAFLIVWTVAFLSGCNASKSVLTISVSITQNRPIQANFSFDDTLTS